MSVEVSTDERRYYPGDGPFTSQVYAARLGARGAKIAAVVAVVVGLVLAKWFGVLELFAEPARLARTIVDLGGWGYLAFIVAYTLLQPFGVPGTVFVFAAPLLWPWPVAFALSMTGTMTASVVGFSFARFVARDWLAPKVPERFRRYDEALAKRGFLTVFLLRFIFWMPPLLHAFFGISKVRFWTHFWGSFVGYLVPLFLVSFFGQAVFDWVRSLPASAWIEIGIATVAIVLAVVLVRWRRSRPSRLSARGDRGL
jgi:uncharacterized membrane protein YdjX (TVP38/TMEM64 family)